jgi:peptidoglycan/xylan/chitin deacetylase (PgdA/CDA1 family)
VIAIALISALGVLIVATGPAQELGGKRTTEPGPGATAPASGGKAVAPAGSGAPPARRVPSWQAQLARRETAAIDRVLRYTPFLSAGTPSRREVALTFDDGPSQYTGAIMKLLLARHVPATFFVVGQQLNNFTPQLKALLRNGFQIGDHTENHAFLRRLNAPAQYGQIHDAAVRIRGAGAPLPRLFRPPYGSYNKGTLATLGRLNMLMVMWSIDPQDWRRPGTGSIISRVLSQARPGAIVLMHDGGGYRDQTVAALPAIIDGLRRRHFHLVSVPRLLLDAPPPRHQRLPAPGGG